MASEQEVVWKFPSSNLIYGSQVIVSEGQAALFVKGGQILDILLTGTHTIISENLPFLNKLVNAPFDNSTPFAAEVWFVSQLHKLNQKWGTRSPIQILDRSLNLPINIRGFGQWGFFISNPQRFIKKFVGSRYSLKSDLISDYFYGFLIQGFNKAISRKLITDKMSVLELASVLDDLSTIVADILRPKLADFGVELLNFNIESITIPDHEIQELRSVYMKTLEAREFSETQLKKSYATIKAFDVMQQAASNPSQNLAGVLVGAGIGNTGASMLTPELINNFQQGLDTSSNNDLVKKFESVKDLFEKEIIDESEYMRIVKKLIEETS